MDGKIEATTWPHHDHEGVHEVLDSIVHIHHADAVPHLPKLNWLHHPQALHRSELNPLKNLNDEIMMVRLVGRFTSNG